jgi:hypothetical protein
LHNSFLSLGLVFITSLTRVPWHLVSPTALKLAGCASHDGLGVATIVNLARAATWPKAHHEVWYLASCSPNQLLLIAANRV